MHNFVEVFRRFYEVQIKSEILSKRNPEGNDSYNSQDEERVGDTVIEKVFQENRRELKAMVMQLNLANLERILSGLKHINDEEI